jgi:primosomal protein N' (replication factor Y)
VIAEVAVFTALDQLFDYRVPPAMMGRVRPGVRVWVPWRSGALEGVVWSLRDEAGYEGRPLKSLGQLVDAPPLDPQRVELLRWIAEYYAAPPGETARLFLPVGGAARARATLRLTDEGKRLAKLAASPLESPEVTGLPKAVQAILPRLLRARSVARLGARAPVEDLVERGLATVEERVVTGPGRAAADAPVTAADEPLPTLTPAQAEAVRALERALAAGAYAPFLLHGVTGSGKTEVYLRVIAAAIARGRRGLVLVPEIALTPQLTARFEARFGGRVAVLHSALSDRERQIAWARLERGEAAIALGARSAVFAPQPELGVVVVDEEHDSSFKQEEGVRYHGRDVALRRARAAGAVAILGSATPSLETYAAARDGRLGLLTLPERATAASLPPVEVVDLRVHKPGPGGFLTAALDEALERTLAAREQAILFLNRRGFSTFVLCRACGQPQRCKHCAVSLTYHRGRDRMLCHYCGFDAPAAESCGACGAAALERLGYGTEQVQAVVQERFPAARVARLDRDTAEGDGLVRLLAGVRAREIDIVVGTQMITKGHDFPSVTLVGVVLADHGMGLPDFRASERTFQLLMQVAGRAGRGDRPGRVLVQTYNPQHPAIVAARDHDYLRFFDGELQARVELGYPPAARLACVRVDGEDPRAVRAAAEHAADAVRRLCARAPADERAEVLGPAEAPLSRLKGRTRWQLFIKARSAHALRRLAREARPADAPRRGPGQGTHARAGAVRISIDVDPVSTL